MTVVKAAQTFPSLPSKVGLRTAGRSSAWLERYVRDVEVARSNRVAPISSQNSRDLVCEAKSKQRGVAQPG